MTDQTEAPERIYIYAAIDEAGDYPEQIGIACAKNMAEGDGLEYVRADTLVAREMLLVRSAYFHGRDDARTKTLVRDPRVILSRARFAIVGKTID